MGGGLREGRLRFAAKGVNRRGRSHREGADDQLRQKLTVALAPEKPFLAPEEPSTASAAEIPHGIRLRWQAEGHRLHAA